MLELGRGLPEGFWLGRGLWGLSGDKGQRGCWHRKGHSGSGARGEVLGMVNNIWEVGGTSGQGKELCRGLRIMAGRRGGGQDTFSNDTGTQNYTKRWSLWGPGREQGTEQ